MSQKCSDFGKAHNWKTLPYLSNFKFPGFICEYIRLTKSQTNFLNVVEGIWAIARLRNLARVQKYVRMSITV